MHGANFAGTTMAGVIRLVVTIVGLVLYYVTMRYFANFSYFWHLIVTSLVLVIGGLVANAVHIRNSRQQGLTGEAQSFTYCYLWQGLLLFALMAHLGYFSRTIYSPSIDSWDKKLLLVIWLLSVIFGIALAIGIELSLKANGIGRFGEPRRVLKSGASWGLVGILLAILLNINYLATEHNIVSDWSYLQVTTLSDSSETMLVDLQKELQVYAFMSRDDEIYPFVNDYLESLASANNRLVTTKVIDKELEPMLADKYRIHANGNLVLVFADDHKKYQKIYLGTELRIARRKLRDLDGQFQKAFLKLTASVQQVYFYQGHDEFTWQYRQDKQRSLRALRALFKKANYQLRELSLDTGSARQIPNDAALVAIVGPRKPLIDTEVRVLRHYLDNGGKALVLLDGKYEGALTDFLQEIGLQFHGQVLANDKTYVAATKSLSDHWFIISNNFTSHPAVKTLAEHDRQTAVLFLQSSYFSIVANDQGWQTQAVIKSIPTTFVDHNRNYTFDQTQETRSTYDICAVAERKGRIYVCADATIISDYLMNNPANRVLISDALAWLQDKKAITSSSEKDLKILHSNNEDLLLFYGTIIVMPLLVLAIGLLANRRKK